MPSTDVSRRRLLAGVGTLGAAALAGCGALPVDDESGDGDESNPVLTLQLEPLDGSLRERHVRAFDDASPAWDEAAFAAALNGSSYTTQYRKPFPTGDEDSAYAVRNGTYYRLDSLVVDEETVDRPVLRLHDAGRLDELDDPPEHVAQSELPEVDARGVRIGYLAARARDDEGGMPVGLVERGGYVYRDAETAEASRLLAESGPSHVAYRDRLWRVETTTETFHEPVYRPDADPVADSPETMERVLRAELVDARLDPGALSDAERDLLREARSGNGLSEPHPFPEALDSLLRKLDHRAFIDGNVEKDAFAGGLPRRRLLLSGDRYFQYRLGLDAPDAE